MQSPRETEELLKRALAQSPTEECELLLEQTAANLTRYGSNAITQNVSRRSGTLTIHLKQGQKEGVSTIPSTFDEKSLREGFAKAKKILDLSKPNEKLLPFLSEKQTYAKTDAWREGVAEHSPDERARKVLSAIERCKKDGLEASGIFEANETVNAYANTKGVVAVYPSTLSTFSLTACTKEGDSEGWAEEEREEPRAIAIDRVIETAVRGAKQGAKPRAHAPGRYTVVLQPAAVSELLLFFSWLGCGAQRWLEGRAYNSGKLGEKFFSDKLTIRDDVTDARAPGMPFDFEGVATRTVNLVEKGVAKELAWDRRTVVEAEKQGVKGFSTTGHGLPQPNPYGPIARHLVMEGDGKSSTEDLVRGMKDGLLVTKLHYCNTVNPMDLSITGMTRSGVWKVENGEVAYPVKNFRFTVSLKDVFSNIEALGKSERAAGPLFGGRSVVPPMRVSGFNMSSSTEF